MKRWFVAALFTLLILSPVIAGAFFIELPLLVLEPGPAVNVEERSKIDAPTYPSKGSIHLTTARVKSPSGSTTLEILKGLLSPDQHVLPREAIYPSGQSDKQTEGTQAAQMTQSESDAATAALNELGMPSIEDGVFVNQVDSKGPSDGKVEPGDVIVALNGSSVTNIEQMSGILEKLDVDAPVEVQVRRGSEEKTFDVRTAEPQKRPGKPEIGVVVSQSHKAPIAISIDADDIGGPSAGLIFAVSIYDRLVPEDLTGGRVIAGTGTIENLPEQSGKVGGVGSVDLKVKGAEKAGADVFLVPKEELAEAKKVAPKSMKVVGISTLSDAIRALRKLAA